MTDTFPNISPDMDSDPTYTPKILRAEFGDGYLQAAGDGINPFKEEWSLSFTARPKADIDAIADFVKSKNGTVPFFWTPPDETTPKKWFTVGAINGPRKVGPDIYSISFDIERTHNL
jgi:phage-related protein